MDIIYELPEDTKLRGLAKVNIEKLKLGLKLGKEVKAPLKEGYYTKFATEIKSKTGSINEKEYLR